LAGEVRGGLPIDREGVLIASYVPFADWSPQRGGVPFRGVRTARYTYVKTIEKPWLLFDHETDPFQLQNRVEDAALVPVRTRLDALLEKMLEEQGDDFPPADVLCMRYGYHSLDAKSCIPLDKGEEWYLHASRQRNSHHG
ncbi:MAG TPA: hypothetical protein DD727_02540, partial [Clostridiales bacterium]|nr:hypothetical protein [Clostridiales bacterium]